MDENEKIDPNKIQLSTPRLMGIPPKESELERERKVKLKLFEEGKQELIICCKNTIDLIQGAIDLGITRQELNILKESLHLHPLDRFGRNKYQNKEKKEIDLDSLIEEVFEISTLFDSEVVPEYFLKEFYKLVQKENTHPHWAITLNKFNKKWNQKKESNQALVNEVVDNKTTISKSTTKYGVFSKFKKIWKDPVISKLIAASIIALFGLIIGQKACNDNSNEQKGAAAFQSTECPTEFIKKESPFKILILPFSSVVENSNHIDVGKSLLNRFNELQYENNINLDVMLLDGTINTNESNLSLLLEKYNADILFYGSVLNEDNVTKVRLIKKISQKFKGIKASGDVIYEDVTTKQIEVLVSLAELGGTIPETFKLTSLDKQIASESYFFTAKLFWKEGHFKCVIRDCDLALDYNSNNVEAYILKACALFKLGSKIEARKLIGEMIRKFPEKKSILNERIEELMK